ncbi:MAG TPA: RNA pseudouridine synthase [Candidatus Baltobacteraceae bacterium]|nr:RNA pseudouridine synthase [Candidatus Baltobacteraceae bacterium]
MNEFRRAQGWTEIKAECTVFEDEDVLVLNKPAGISVVGEKKGSDLITLAHDAGERLLPVHRIDKVTSGAVIFAKESRVQAHLTRQFSERSINKLYLVLTRSHGLPDHGMIDLPLSVGRKNMVRVGAHRKSIMVDQKRNSWSVAPSDVFTYTRTYPSLTLFAKVWDDDRNSLLVVRPITGRRHQIRIHLAWIGHSIEGDPLFNKKSADHETRTFLHSWRLALNAAWSTGTRLELEAPPGDDFFAPIRERLPKNSLVTALESACRAIEKATTSTELPFG